MAMDTERVGTYRGSKLVHTMEGLLGMSVDDVMRVLIEPLDEEQSRVAALSRVRDGNKTRFDDNNELVLEEKTLVLRTKAVQEALEGVGIKASEYYSIDAQCTYTENGTYDRENT